MNYDWTRLPQQQAFLTTRAQFSVFSGGVGTGKSSALCARILALSTFIPNNNGYLGRKDGKSLRQTTLKLLLEMMPEHWRQSHDKAQGLIVLRKEFGGSTIVYGDLKDRADMMNHDLGWFAFDQMEEVDEQDWDLFAGRLRRRLPVLDEQTESIQYQVEGRCPRRNGERHWVIGEKATTCSMCGDPLPPFFEGLEGAALDPPWKYVGYPRYGFGVCNTENPDNWIYRTFQGLPGEKDDVSEGLPGYQGFSATIYDSLQAGYVDREYVESLEQKYKHNPLLHQRYMVGKWVTAEGLVFPGFNKTEHVFHREGRRWDGNELIPQQLPVFEYIDPGTAAVTAIGWIVIEVCACGCHRHNFYVVAEHYVASPFPAYHCSQMKEIRKELRREVGGTWMDAQAFSKTNIQHVTETNEDKVSSVSQLYIEQGIFPQRNQKDWESGWMRMSDMLAIDPLHTHPLTGVKGAPHLMVASHCIHWIKEILNYKYKPHSRHGDEPVDKDDHHMDGSVGFFAGRPEYRVVAPELPDTRPAHVRTLEDELKELTDPDLVYYY